MISEKCIQLVILSLLIFFNQLNGVDYISSARELHHKYTLEVIKKYDLSVVGVGGGIGEEIDGYHILLSAHRPLNKEESRKLLLEILDGYLLIINKKRDLRPYFINYPLDDKGVSIAITIDLEDETYPRLGMIHLVHGTIIYEYYLNKNHNIFKGTREEIETVQEARAILNQK